MMHCIKSGINYKFEWIFAYRFVASRPTSLKPCVFPQMIRTSH